jgi:glutamyl endopeptidase
MKKILLICVIGLAISAAGQNNDPENYIPLPLPKWSEPINPSASDNYLLQYDVSSGTESIVDSNNHHGTNEQYSMESFIPDDIEVIEEPAGTKNFTGLEPVNNTTVYPASGNVKLFMRFPNSNSTFIASGILLSKNVVLTAAHCIFDNSLGGYASAVWAVPGYYYGNEPFGRAYASNFSVWTAWTNNNNYDWDIGLVLFNKCIGEYTGNFGAGTYNDDFFRTNNFHNYSYPASGPYNGEKMYYRHGSFDQVTEHILYFNSQSYGGQSGSGFYYKDPNEHRCTYAVLSHGNSANQTGCTRITSPKFDWIWETVNGNKYCVTIGIEESTENNLFNFQIFPNPAIENVSITFQENQELCTISVINLLGKNVIQKKLYSGEKTITLPIENLEDGYYFISLNDGKSSITKSFIKASSKY